MSYFTDVFHALDYNNTGFILINDFKNKIQTYINADPSDVNSGEALIKFIELVKVCDDGKVFFEDFLNGINAVERFMKTQKLQVVEDCPFINDGDNYSTDDIGFDDDFRNYQDFNRNDNLCIGKMNKKLIKRSQQSDILRNKDIVEHHLSQNDVSNADYTKSNYFKGDFDLPLDDLMCSCNGRRQSDVVICGRRKVTQLNKYEDAHSLNCWAPSSVSAADLFYYDSMTDIQKSLQKLEQSAENLQKISVEAKQSKRKHSDENFFLIKQIQSLEERNRELVKQFEKDLYLERESARKNLGKLVKMKTEEIEYLKWSIKTKEEEFESQRKEFQMVITDNDRLRYDKVRSEDKMMDLLQQMTNIEEEMKRLKDFHNRELEVLKSERNTVLMKAAKFEGRNVNKEENDISNLKSKNCILKRKLEECESELLALSVFQGQSILQSTKSDNNWMKEIDGYTKDEIIDLLVKEKDGNFRLREYVSRILTRIMNKDPSLLEIS